MRQWKSLAVGVAIVLVALVALLRTDNVGLTEDLSPTSSVSEEVRWRFLLEDAYDRQAYMMRGRWIVSDGTPYLEEFSEYPQLTTLWVGVPYLFFDHGVEPGEPHTTTHRVRAWFLERDVEPAAFEKVLEAVVASSRDRIPARQVVLTSFPSFDRWPAALRADRDEVERQVADLLSVHGDRQDEFVRNVKAYGDVFHVLAAGWWIALLLILTLILRSLGLPPAWALMVLLPGTLYFGFNRADLPVTTFMALSVLLQLRGRPLGSAGALAVAGMFKWFPLFLFPLFLSYGWRRAVARAQREGSAAPWRSTFVPAVVAPTGLIGAICTAVLAITWFWDGGGLPAVRFLVDWHLERNHNHASVVALLCNPAGWGVFEYAALDQWKKIFLALQLLPPFLLALLPLRTPRSFLLATCLSINGLIFFSKFFSPQWVIWLVTLSCPLVARSRPLLGLLIALQAAIYLQLPLAVYDAAIPDLPLNERGFFWFATNLRVAVMVAIGLALAVALVRSLRRSADGEPLDAAAV